MEKFFDVPVSIALKRLRMYAVLESFESTHATSIAT